MAGDGQQERAPAARGKGPEADVPLWGRAAHGRTGRAAGTYPDEGARRGFIVPAVPSEGLSAAYAGRNARRTAGAAGRMADKPAGPQL